MNYIHFDHVIWYTEYGSPDAYLFWMNPEGVIRERYGFRMELKYKPEGLIKNHICDFYSLTDNGYLYFESYIKDLQNILKSIGKDKLDESGYNIRTKPNEVSFNKTTGKTVEKNMHIGYTKV